MAEPATKKARTEGEDNGDQQNAPEMDIEPEKDAPKATGAKVDAVVEFQAVDTTMNVMCTTSLAGHMLRPLTEGCFQYLLAGARASVGIKAGRYMFETKIIENLSPTEVHGNSGNGPRCSFPKQFVRIGFSTPSAGLFLDDEESVSFDSEGILLQGTETSAASQPFSTDSVVAVLLNVDKSSPNCNTVSLFKDGVRLTQPKLLPETLRGKVLYPTVVFKNVTLHLNFGPNPLSPLPFECRMVGHADKKDAVIRPARVAPKDGKYEVLYPVGLPDEGPFDWLDFFLKKNPHYTELSERAIVAWVSKSGVKRTGHAGHGASLDQPELGFGVPSLDDRSMVGLLQLMASVQLRDYIVMEVKGNLMKEERSERILRLPKAHYKHVAYVVIGEPPADFLSYTHNLMLKDKQEASDAAFKAKQAEDARQKQMRKRQREVERARRKMEIQRKKLEAERKRKIAEEEAKIKEEEKAKEEEERKRKLADEMRAKEEAATKTAGDTEKEANGNEAVKVSADVSTEKNDEEKEGDENEQNAVENEKTSDEKQPKEEVENEKASDEEKPEGAVEKKMAGDEVKLDEDMEKEKASDEKKPEEDKKPEEKKPEEDKKPVEEEEENKKPVEEEEEDEKDESESEAMDEDPPVVELSSEEKAHKFRKCGLPDISPAVMNRSFTSFSLPKEEEGFDECRYAWTKVDKCAEYMKKWILERKLTTRVEDIVPSAWFRGKWAVWQETFQDWTAKQLAYKAAEAKHEAQKRLESNRRTMAAAKAAFIKAKKEAEKKKESANEQKKGDDGKDVSMDSQAEQDPEKQEQEKLVEEVDDEKYFEDLDVFGVEDVCDIGRGMPLFKDFSAEDWAMVSLRFELHLLVHAFRHDVGDPERKGVHLDQLSFYYTKYFRKTLVTKAYGADTIDALIRLVSDTLYVTKQRLLETFIPDEIECLGIFAKITEEARRTRTLLVDAGDESARLVVQLQTIGAEVVAEKPSFYGDGQGSTTSYLKPWGWAAGGKGKAATVGPTSPGKGFQPWNKGGFKAQPYAQQVWRK